MRKRRKYPVRTMTNMHGFYTDDEQAKKIIRLKKQGYNISQLVRTFIDDFYDKVYGNEIIQ